MAKQKLNTEIEPDTEDEIFEFMAEMYADEIQKVLDEENQTKNQKIKHTDEHTL